MLLRPVHTLRRRLCVLSIPFILSACSVADLEPTAAAPQLPATYRLANAPAPSVAATGENWWHPFHDPVLDGLLSRTAERNLTVAQARQRLVAARALAHSEIASYSPSLGVTGLAQGATGKSNDKDLTRRPLQFNLELGWEVALFSEDKLKQKAADLSASMAAEDLNAARLAVTTETASTYVKLRALQKRADIARGTITLLSRSQRLATNRAQNGLDTRLQADAAAGRLDAAKLEGTRLETAIADTLQQIATLQGSATYDASLASAHPQPRASIFQTSSQPADLLRRRPDVRRAEMTVLQAGAELGLAQADLYPKLHLSGMIGIGTPVNGNLFGLMGGPSLQLPILDQGKRHDLIVARKAMLEEATAAYRQSVLVAYEEASTAIRALQIARQNVARQEGIVSSARRASKAAGLLQREGLADASGSVSESLSVLEAENQLSQAIEDEALAQIAVVKVMAGTASPVAPPAARTGG
ncbi:TolC family protein [Rhizobium sp. AG855]|uniref:TolC family protein n=1 Tax=Rhizobium sp. AG855 TaxID=2183898 RepID=UPI000FEFDD44|nr:TolC family protein [Rhizobium sp. AG855]RKE77388.1 NodT family efflux transporter outer membrane factor (OMF) lipoprotein [Rhizobium sp. AG855]